MDINFVSRKLLYDDIIRRGSLLTDDKGKKADLISICKRKFRSIIK